MGKSIIAWTDFTWNPTTGCSKPPAVPTAALRFTNILPRTEAGDIPVKWLNDGSSPECAKCYAEALSLKRGWTAKPWHECHADENVRVHPSRLKQAFGWQKQAPRIGLPSKRLKVFTNSMSDMFHRNVPDTFLRDVFGVMNECPDVLFQVLTKRPDRAAEWRDRWPENIWLGTTCGHPSTKWRIEYLRRAQAKVRFISAEPLLDSLVPIDLSGIHQVIVGGESGPGYRRMDHQWARELRDACVDQGVAYFFKQSASWRTEMDCWLLEEDGRAFMWRQFPDEFSDPVEVFPDPKRIAIQRAGGKL